MSGLEVAGVVIGALPLIIAALEHYAQGVNTAKRYWRYKTELRSLILQIDTERGIFVNTLEQLLTGIVRTEHMAELISDPQSATWRMSDVDKKLRDRLRDAYDVYLGNLKGMDMSLKMIGEKLALDHNGKPQFSDLGLFKQEFKRLKFSITKAEYSDQLQKLKNYNHALARLTKQSLDLEPTRVPKTRSYPNFRTLQSYARSLYETLRSELQCTRGCQEHTVNLRLENRNELLESEKELPEHTRFRVVFTHTSDTGWREVVIRCVVDKPIPGPSTLLVANTTSATPNRKQVRFGQLHPQLEKTHMDQSTTVTITNQHTMTTLNISQERIQDLCKAIYQLQQPERDTCLGYLVDSLQRKHVIYPLLPLRNCSQRQWSAYSLHEILTSKTSTNRRLTQLDKLQIAVDLSSSVLQLYETPWLDESWGDEDVYFIQRPGAPSTSIYEHPYVLRNFSSSAPPTHSTKSRRTKIRVIRNQTLYTLGILLIEVWYGKSIHELQTTSDLDCQGTPGISWCTAERLVENDLEFEAGKRFTDAVRRCIRCDFNRKDVNLQNESFQIAVFEGVVAPLEKTLQQFKSLD